jgi:hypothetical protein
LAPVPLSGLADHENEPDVALPGAVDAPLLVGNAVLLLMVVVVPPPALVPLLLHPARTNAPAAPTRAVSCQPLTWRLPGYLRDLRFPPLKVVIW